MRPIIVCGCDNSGKTTLISTLAEIFDLHVRVSCRSLPLTEQVAWVQEQIEDCPVCPIIYDRFSPISDEVYGPVVRNGSLFDGLMAEYGINWDEYFQRVVLSMNPIIIFARPDTMEMVRTIEEREQMEGVQENLLEIIQRYDAIMYRIKEEFGATVLKYNWLVDPEAHRIASQIAVLDKHYLRKYKEKYNTVGRCFKNDLV